MNWDLSIGLLGTAASLAGLAWNRENVKKLAFIVLALLAFTLIVKGILYQFDISRVQTQIFDAIGKSMMSADQLYENINTAKVTRPLFNDALSKAVDTRHIKHRKLELHTAEGTYIRVRAYFIP